MVTRHLHGLVAVLAALGGIAIARDAAPQTNTLPPGAVVRLGTTHFRHAGLVTDVAWSPDGTTVASSGQDQSVRLWDPTTGEERARLLGHTGPVRSLVFSPDGKTIATCSHDKLVCLWDATALGVGTIRPRQFAAHTDGVQAVCFTPDGKSLVSGGWDGQVIVWDVVSGAVLRRFGSPPSRVRTLALAPDGRTLAVAHVLGTPGKSTSRVLLWDVTRGEASRAVGDTWPEEVHALAFSPDGETLAVGGDRGPTLWEAASGSRLTQLRELTSSRYTPSLVFSPDGGTVFAGGGGFLRGWKVSTGQPTRAFDLGAMSAYGLSFSPDGKTLAAATTRAVMLWDAATGKPSHSDSGHLGEVSAVCFTPDGKELWTGGYDRPIYRWDVSTGKQIGQLLGSRLWNTSLVLSPDGRTLVTFDDNLTIVLLDTAAGKERLRFTKHLPPRVSGMTSMRVAFSSDSRIIVSCAHGIDPHVRLWEADTGKELLAIDCGGEAVGPLDGPGRRRGDNLTGVALSPDGKVIYTSSQVSSVRVWDAATGKEIRQIGRPDLGIRELVLSRDGRRLAGCTGQESEGVIVWDTATGTPLASFPRPRGYAVRLAFSTDGRTLAISSEAGPVRMWEIASRQCRLQWTAHAGVVKGAAFAPDSRFLATCGDDTTAMIWDVQQLARAGEMAVAPSSDAKLWTDLGSNAEVAYRATTRLIASPRKAVDLLAGSLKPGGRTPIARLIKDLDDDDFAKREAATEALATLGRAAEETMRKALNDGPSLEVRRRLELVLENLDKETETDRERLQTLRGLEVLEAIGTRAARKVLETMADGPPEAEATADARAALSRLERHQ